MRRVAVRAAAVLALIGMCGFSFAQDDQRPDGPRRSGEGRGGFGQGRGEGGPGRGGFGGGRFQPPAHPLMVALDADEDGEISASEIQNAMAALKKLDKNNDGKLAGEEIEPPRPSFGGFGGGRFGGGFGGRGPGGPDGERESMSARLLSQYDKNEDGQVSKEELSAIPEAFLSRLMERDTNNDGVLDKAELEAMDADRPGGRGGRPDGDRPRGGRPGGDRPDRPEIE